MSSDEKRVNNQQDDSGSSGQAIPVTIPPPPPSLPLNCPRCNSNNTKFCYYNNYNSRQPRHFCRACKRYWTQGGTLRNIPIGSGNRKSKTSTRSSSLRVSSGDCIESSGDSSYSAIDRIKYFDGQELHDQLGDLSIYPTVHSVSANLSVPVVGGQLVSALGNIPTPPVASTAVTDQRLDQLGDQIEGLLPEFGPTNFEDFSWNVEQEGLDMMYMNGGESINFDQQQDDMIGATNPLVETQQPQPTLFQRSEMPPNYDPRNVNTGDVNAAHFASTDPWYGGSAGYDAPVLDQVPSSNGSGNGSQAWTNFGHYPTMP